ncbi:MarR family winged helix-turn-helix transcriptional regulator [Dactylosporangium matsuzakiense]|uniref:HTH marR-type domain-containing protein n=1 Tax=Dactylosporangium matsuzakiense TaxID=53360 RepID=A0A9W6NJG3_9ACTN|nr:MarR family transcriptional regulator [Dactylosporangium matsuzakiense]UWZ42250.1 MarR family transcriptional regulator [Dactylosporangium matsuzakiense]GLK99904.1 hypothetical protein GCM10017581_016450 [Dactylosporangium matsuzakiense]
MTGSDDHVVRGYSHLAEAFVTASRVLVAVAARSLAVANTEITPAQHRALVIPAWRGPQRIADLAEPIEANICNGTRSRDRLQHRGLVRCDPGDRRAVRVALTPAGKHLAPQITAARSAKISHMLSVTPEHARGFMLTAMRAFTDGAGEVPNKAGRWAGTPIPTPVAPAQQGEHP